MVAKDQHSAKEAEASNRLSKEELFNKLPPLDSDEFVEFVRSGARADLPPEVLARAYRLLPPEASGALETLKRLFRRMDDKRWEYLQPLVKKARKKEALHQGRIGKVQYEDLLQDAFSRILEVLPTAQGAFAERAWNTFCRNQFENAWREKYGRRGERRDPKRAEPLKVDREEGDQEQDPLEMLGDKKSLYQVLSQNDHSVQIEAIASVVAKDIEDPFCRAVAQATWFSNKRPKTSGTTKPDQEKTLMEQFPDKSRDQVNRALRRVDSLLATALLDHEGVSWPIDLRRLLERQKSRGKRP